MKKTTKKEKITRVTIDLSAQHYKMLSRIQHVTGQPTKAAVVRDMIRIGFQSLPRGGAK